MSLNPFVIPPQDLEGLDQLAIEELGIQHGLPLGFLFAGGMNIETNSPILKALLAAKKRATEAENIQDQQEKRPPINHWKTRWRGKHGTVVVFLDQQTGRVKHVFAPSPTPQRIFTKMFFDSLNAQNTYSVLEAEERAQERLRADLNEYQWACYQLSGTVTERGRSGVFYILRKNRPTIALRVGERGLHTLCTLCLHPLAYYSGTWTGALPPSDEVRTHLLMIRANEHYFWRKAVQHPITDVESGLFDL